MTQGYSDSVSQDALGRQSAHTPAWLGEAPCSCPCFASIAHAVPRARRAPKRSCFPNLPSGSASNASRSCLAPVRLPMLICSTAHATASCFGIANTTWWSHCDVSSKSMTVKPCHARINDHRYVQNPLNKSHLQLRWQLCSTLGDTLIDGSVRAGPHQLACWARRPSTDSRRMSCL